MIEVNNAPRQFAELLAKTGSADASAIKLADIYYRRGLADAGNRDEQELRLGCNTRNPHIAPALADIPCMRERVPACEGCARGL